MKRSPNQKRSPRKLKSLAQDKLGALNPRDSVETAANRMREKGTKSWPVADNRRLIGTVDETEPDLTMTRCGHDPKAWQVSEIMNRRIIFCYDDEDCVTAWKLMEKHDLNYLPVVDREMQLMGIFDREEIARKAASAKTKGSPGRVSQ